MSRYISLDGFIDEPKDVITINQVEFHWGKLPHIPQTHSGKLEVKRLMDSLQRKQQAKVEILTEKLMAKQYHNLKKNMRRFAKKSETNFFSPSPQSSLSLQTTPRIDLQQKYGYKIYPRLMAIKQTQQILMHKTRNRTTNYNYSVDNVKKIHHALSTITKHNHFNKQTRRSQIKDSKILKQNKDPQFHSFTLSFNQNQLSSKLNSKQNKVNQSTNTYKKSTKNKFSKVSSKNNFYHI